MHPPPPPPPPPIIGLATALLKGDQVHEFEEWVQFEASEKFTINYLSIILNIHDKANA
jgi:hypothetical protein